MKNPAPRHNPPDFTRLPEEHFGLLEEVVIRHTGAAPREAQRTANAVIRQAKIRPPGDGPLFIPQALARLDPGVYGEMEATVIRRTGLDPQAARDLVDGILGPLMITPPMVDGPDYQHHPDSGSCPHVYYGFDGGFRQCVVDHREPGADMTLHGRPQLDGGSVWRTGDRRDMNVEEFQW